MYYFDAIPTNPERRVEYIMSLLNDGMLCDCRGEFIKLFDLKYEWVIKHEDYCKAKDRVRELLEFQNPELNADSQSS